MHACLIHIKSNFCMGSSSWFLMYNPPLKSRQSKYHSACVILCLCLTFASFEFTARSVVMFSRLQWICSVLYIYSSWTETSKKKSRKNLAFITFVYGLLVYFLCTSVCACDIILPLSEMWKTTVGKLIENTVTFCKITVRLKWKPCISF